MTTSGSTSSRVALAIAAGAVVHHGQLRASLRQALGPPDGAKRGSRPCQGRVHHRRVRRIAARSMSRLALAVTPNALTAAGVPVHGRRNRRLLRRTGRARRLLGRGRAIHRRVDPGHPRRRARARTSGKATPFGAFVDSMTDRERGRDARVDRARFHAGRESGRARVHVRGRGGPSRLLQRARRRRSWACAATSASAAVPERVVVISAGLILACGVRSSGRSTCWQ